MGEPGRHFRAVCREGASGRFLEARGSDFGLCFNADRPLYVEAEFPDNAGVHRPFRLLSLPRLGVAEKVVKGDCRLDAIGVCVAH